MCLCVMRLIGKMKFNQRKYIIIIIIPCLLLLIYLFNLFILQRLAIKYYQIVLDSESVATKVLKEQNKYILLWQNFYQDPSWMLDYDPDGIAGIIDDNNFYLKQGICPVTNCIFTKNRTLLQSITDFDAILFHTAEINKFFDIAPAFRSPRQKYVSCGLEPPALSIHDLKLDDNFFNWTMTYRLDSDIPWIYSVFYDKLSKVPIQPVQHRTTNWRQYENDFYDPDLIEQVKSKTKFAAWFVSNCKNVHSKRGDLAKGIQKLAQVDVYGKCGPLKCTNTTECNYLLDHNYKFYLSFENSLCQDYVSEKLFNNMDRLIIPIVYGGADYAKFAPPHSYIDANNYTTVKELVEYMNYLSENPLEYIKYFWWKKYYKRMRGLVLGFCDLCAKLHQNNNENIVQYYQNIDKWWNRECYSPKINFL